LANHLFPVYDECVADGCKDENGADDAEPDAGVGPVDSARDHDGWGRNVVVVGPAAVQLSE
jgi:hypothetical protein